jgi:hypothetical protein
MQGTVARATHEPSFSFKEALAGFKKVGKRIIHCSYNEQTMNEKFNPGKSRRIFLEIFFTFHSITSGVPIALLEIYKN